MTQKELFAELSDLKTLVIVITAFLVYMAIAFVLLVVVGKLLYG